MSSIEANFEARAGAPLRGRLRVPGDKSISHRAVILGALATGTTTVDGFLEARDTLATVAAMRALGVPIDAARDGRLSITGVGMHGLHESPSAIDLGNSGTAMRLLLGVLAGQSFPSELGGDVSLSGRPMGRVVEPLRQMGARIDTAAGGRPPLRIRPPGRALHGIDYRLPVASAQIKSCLLLAGLGAAGTTCVREDQPTRDHTERMLAGFGCAPRVSAGRTSVDGGGALVATHVEVPGDLSSAAFLLVAAAGLPGSDLVVEAVGVNPTRTGVLTILGQMGASIEVLNRRESGGEAVADIHVRGSRLHGIEIEPALVPLAIDEFPALFAAAACAEGTTVVRGAAELRVKESDRIASMASVLGALGGRVRELPDGAVIEGAAELRGGSVDSAGDHRVAMASVIVALHAAAPVRIADCANVDTSFPGFIETARGCGIDVRRAA